jgi:hypothetical protein
LEVTTLVATVKPLTQPDVEKLFANAGTADNMAVRAIRKPEKAMRAALKRWTTSETQTILKFMGKV